MHFEILIEDQSGKRALDTLMPGGSAALSTKGWQAIGAEKITPHMDVNNNASPSFGYLRKKTHGINWNYFDMILISNKKMHRLNR